ncbi:MAG: hydrogenase subunit MbhD domain-containing protein [Candidatus Thermoplasmatota archaeon]
MLIEFIHILILLSMIVSALIAVFLRDLLAAVVALAAMSLLLSLEFYILHAPDVAIAQAGVGACLSTAILIIAIRSTKQREDES